MWSSWLKFIFLFVIFSVAFAKPNVLVFLVDDLGIADLGCFGNDTIKTPNIDRLAEQGARLRHDVTPDSICTPNRAAFLTGRYPIRSGLASDQGQIRVFIFAASSGGLPPNETTFAEIASAAGYKTGMLLCNYHFSFPLLCKCSIYFFHCSAVLKQWALYSHIYVFLSQFLIWITETVFTTRTIQY